MMSLFIFRVRGQVAEHPVDGISFLITGLFSFLTNVFMGCYIKGDILEYTRKEKLQKENHENNTHKRIKRKNYEKRKNKENIKRKKEQK